MATASDLREIAMSLPEVEERITWESPTFRIRGKIFVILHPAELSATIKARKDEQAELLEMDPATFSPAPYTGRFGWISARLAGVAANDLSVLVTEAWQQAAPRSLTQSYIELSDATPRQPQSGSYIGTKRAPETPA